MPDSDMDSVAHTMEGSGLFDPTVLATTPKKRKAKKKKKSRIHCMNTRNSHHHQMNSYSWYVQCHLPPDK